ncbi:MAG: dipeptide epimerase [Bacteroidetes bacterium]|nr:MAG: dipeptide epimerase [Bacteroidota bacterium]
MQIKNIEIWKADLGLTRPYSIAGESTSSTENAFLRIELTNGHWGIGSAAPSERVCNERMEDTMAGLEKGAERLKGKDVGAFEALKSAIAEELIDTPAARAAIDMALYDVFCKSLDVRVVDYLGQKHTSLPTSITIGIKEDQGVKADLEEFIAKGFSIVKIKIGTDVERDISILKKLREWGGSAIKIRVDANQGYSKIHLAELIQETRGVGLEFVEQPYFAPALVQMRDLSEGIRSQCMADEDLKSRSDAVAMTRGPLPYGSWNIKLMKSGGVTGGKWIGDLAGMYGIPLMWGCMDESRVSIAAALHTAFSCRATQYLDLDGSFDLATDVVTGGFEVKDGIMYLTDAPGLGVKSL